MKAAVLALVSSVGIVGPAMTEDWFILSVGDGWAYGADKDSIRIEGVKRAFRSFSAEGDGYGLATVTVDCDSGRIQITPDGAAALEERSTTGAVEDGHIARVCAYPVGFDTARRAHSLNEILAAAEESMNGPPPPLRCPGEPALYARTEADCPARSGR